MKKIISLTLVCVMLLACVFTLASCGKRLSGTYSQDLVGLAGVSYEFSGKNVAVTFSFLGTETTVDGSYEIGEDEDGKSIITFSFEDEKAEKYDGTFSFAEGKEEGTDYIKIGGVRYDKKD